MVAEVVVVVAAAVVTAVVTSGLRKTLEGELADQLLALKEDSTTYLLPLQTLVYFL